MITKKKLDFIIPVYHEDENVICGRHSFEAPDEPKQQVMFFARYEDGKCKFWKVHGS